MSSNSVMHPVKVGMFTTGMQTYWSQMPHIKQEILSYAEQIEEKLSQWATVINAGIVDNIATARRTGDRFVAEDVDLVVIHAGTYGLSRDVLPCLRKRSAFVLMLHLQPVDTFDESSDTDYTMPKNPFSIAGEIGAVLQRTGIDFEVVAGRLSGTTEWNRIREWIGAAGVRRKLRYANIGVLGTPYMGMLDLYVDRLRLIDRFGIHIELIEMAALRKCVESISTAEVNSAIGQLGDFFKLSESVTDQKLKWPMQVALGMEKLCEELNLNALTYQYNGYPDSPEEKIGYSMTLGGSVLYQRGIPCPVEGDVNVSIALIIMEACGSKATQAELNIIDFENGINYINHSGPGNIAMAQSKPTLRWLDFFHGRRGSGVSCEFSVQCGPITLFSILHSKSGDLEFLTAEGTSVEGLLLPNGNMNTRVLFPQLRPEELVSRWVSMGPTHHSAMGLGHRAACISKIARLYGIQCTKIG